MHILLCTYFSFSREFGVQVKSVVSASFSEEEIKYLLQQGNAVCLLHTSTLSLYLQFFF